MRHHAMRQKIPSEFGSLYLEIEYTDELRVTQINLTHRGRMKMTVVGGLIEKIAEGINDLLSDLRLSRAGRVIPEVAVPPKAAALPNADLPELAPATRAQGPSFQGEQPFEGGGE